MQLKAFSLLDTKTGIFNTPFFLPHVGQAIRACCDLGQDKNTTVGRYPSDYALVEVGTWDDQTAQLHTCSPINHGTVAAFLPASQPLPLFSQLQEPEKPNGAYAHAADTGAR